MTPDQSSAADAVSTTLSQGWLVALGALAGKLIEKGYQLFFARADLRNKAVETDGKVAEQQAAFIDRLTKQLEEERAYWEQRLAAERAYYEGQIAHLKERVSALELELAKTRSGAFPLPSPPLPPAQG